MTAALKKVTITGDNDELRRTRYQIDRYILREEFKRKEMEFK